MVLGVHHTNVSLQRKYVNDLLRHIGFFQNNVTLTIVYANFYGIILRKRKNEFTSFDKPGILTL